MVVKRNVLGLPLDWKRVNFWLKYRGKVPYQPKKPRTDAPLKFPEIPLLLNYDGSKSELFWEVFPYCELPSVPKTQVDVNALESEVA